MKAIILGITTVLLAASASAITIILTDIVDQEIPDGSFSGLSRSIDLNVERGEIESISVEVALSPAEGTSPVFCRPFGRGHS